MFSVSFKLIFSVSAAFDYKIMIILLSCTRIVSNGNMFKYVGQKSKDTKIKFKKQLSGQLD